MLPHLAWPGRVRAAALGVANVMAAAGIALAALPPGAAHAATLPDLTPYSWGYSTTGDLGTGLVNAAQNTPTALPGLGGITSNVAAGLTHGLAVAGGTVYAWGDNQYGQLGTTPANPYNVTTPQLVPGLTNVTTVAAGLGHSLALKDDGTVWAWGGNSGVMGVTRAPCAQPYMPAPCVDRPMLVLSSAGLTSVAAGAGHSFAIANGQVLSWGSNSIGELGDGTQMNRTSPVLLSSISGVQSIASGTFHTLALMNDGTVQAWGDPGAIGRSCANNVCLTPAPVAGLSGIYGISAGMAFNLAVTGQSIQTICMVCGSPIVPAPGLVRPPLPRP